MNQSPLTVRLGFREDARVLIVNADDAGMCHAANMAVMKGMERERITSCSVMVCCPWYLEMADYGRRKRDADLGVHLTHTSEWEFYRWGVTASTETVRGLLDPSGRMWSHVQDVYAHATPAEAYEEGRRQIRIALESGIDVTHIDSHMGTMQLHPAFYEKYVQLAREFDLPLRMASQETIESYGFSGMREAAAEAKLVFPDYLIHGGRREGEDIESYWRRMLLALRPGVTELYIHPQLPTDESQAITGSWRDRSTEFRLFTTDARIGALMRQMNVQLIGWRRLRELQRRG